MGLDMYLRGEAFYGYDHPNRKLKPHPISSTTFDLGYWRKHPNLHGYIVNTFADGVDNCQEIELSADDLRQVMQAVENKDLPHTTGFFFGESDGSEAPGDMLILQTALDWLETKEPSVYRSVLYRASW